MLLQLVLLVLIEVIQMHGLLLGLNSQMMIICNNLTIFFLIIVVVREETRSFKLLQYNAVVMVVVGGR